MERLLMQNTQQMLSQMGLILDFYTTSMESTINIVENAAPTEAFINGSADTEALRRFLRTITANRPEIAGILVVNGNGKYVSDGIFQRSRDSLLNENWYKRAAENPGQYVMISKPVGRNLTSHSRYGDDEIMSIVKAPEAGTAGHAAGAAVLIDFHLSAFDEYLKSITLGSAGFLYVTDEAGEIIYTPYNDVVYRIDNRYLIERPKEKTIVKIRDEYYQVVCRNINYWYIMGVFLHRDTIATVTTLRYMTVALLVSTILLVRWFSARLNKTVVAPLRRLDSLMKSAEEGNMEACCPTGGDDEISALGDSFNRMISKIRELLVIIEQENKLKRDAEFKVLQEQIKPHFLYNSLDTINWLAMDCGAHEIVWLVGALTKLFRLSLSGGREFITVEEEAEQVENYLIIQSIRYEEMISYSFDIGEEVKGLTVLKLILQPLVENGVYHGIKERAYREPGFRGHIHVSAHIGGEDLLLLTVRDDGLGAPPAVASEIERMLESDEHTMGFGLYNISRRLKYTFGDRYGLTFRSVEGEGAEVVISHPVLDTGETPAPNRRENGKNRSQTKKE
jgi:two-component system sensor histidine kinase YesM